MSKSVFANLGFVMQIAGMFMVLPIAASFHLNEGDAFTSYLITAILLFGLGFVLNTFSKREDMDFKSASVLIVLVFVSLSLIGSVPYMYLGIFDGDPFTSFTNSFFESVSTFTTAGFSLIGDIDSVPDSLVLYRGVMQWIAGIGIIFVLLAFFYPIGDTLKSITSLIGLEKMIAGIKLILGHVIAIYALYAVVFTAILYLIGFTNVLDSASLVLSIFATGGFSPLTNFANFTDTPAFIFILLGMFLGSLNFFVHDKIIQAKIQATFRTELKVFIAILVAGSILFFLTSGLSLRDSVFTAVSASTTSGYSVVSIDDLNESSKMVLIFLMFIGGMTFSTAGGLKVLRLVIFLKSIPWSIQRLIQDPKRNLSYEGNMLEESEVQFYIIMPSLVIATIFVSIFIFALHGYSISSGLFESVSAYSLVGFTTSEINADMPLTLQWWMSLLMIIGRVEIILFLIALVGKKVSHLPTSKDKSFAQEFTLTKNK